MMTFFILYLGLINLLAFALYGSDKHRARRSEQRISEAALLAIALLGGAFGAWAAMYLFRHKTRHVKFVLCVPLFLLLHGYLIYRFVIE